MSDSHPYGQQPGPFDKQPGDPAAGPGQPGQPGGPYAAGPYPGTPYPGGPYPAGPYPQQPGGYAVDPNAPYGYDPYGRPYSSKTKLVAGLLQILVGGVGAGRWYTGHYGLAIGQLLTCGGLGIWALIDGIYLLASDGVTDADGRVLRSS